MKRRILLRALAYLTITLFLLLVLVIGLFGYLLQSRDGSLWLFDMARNLTPGELQIDSLEGSLSGPLKIHGLRYQADDLLLEVGQLRLNWLPRALLQGRVHILALGLEGSRLQLPKSTPEEQPGQAFNGLRMPLKLTLDALNITDLQVIPADATEPLQLERADLQARLEGDKLTIVKLEAAAFSAQAKLAGILHLTPDIPVELKIEWRYQLPDGPELGGIGPVSGDLAELHLQQALTAPVSGQLRASVYELALSPRWDAQLQLDDADIGAFIQDFPARISGRIASSGDLQKSQASAKLNLFEPSLGKLKAELQSQYAAGSFKAERLLLTTPSGMWLEGRGDYRMGPEDETLAVDLSWRDLRWPLSGKQVQFRSAQGALQVTGRTDDYRYRLDLKSEAPGLPPAQVDASGTGNLEGLNLTELGINLAEGRIQGSGQVSWLPEPAWQVELNGEELNPALFDASFPGKLKLALASEGRIHAGTPHAKLQLHQLEGVLLDHPLQANGDISLDDRTLHFSSIQLLAGANRAQLTGSMGDNLNLKWSVDAPQLDTLWPWLSGRLSGTGEVSGPSASPRIQADIQGEQIAYQNNRIARLHNRVELDLGDSQKMELSLQAENLQAGDMLWESLHMSTKGVINKHHIDLRLQGKEVPQAWLVMDGGLSADYLWNGKLQQLTLDTLDLGEWRLAAPAAFAFGMETQRFDPICLQATDSRVCGTFDAEITQGWQAALQATNLPLAYLQHWLPEETNISGKASLQADFTADTQGHMQGNANLNLPEGQLTFALEGEPQVVNFSSGQMQAVIDQQGGRAKLTLPLGNLGNIEGEASLPGLSVPYQLEQQVIEGRLHARLEELGLISAVAPNLQNVRGRIQADFSLAGRLNKPRLQGQAELQDGAVDIPEAGIELRSISLLAKAPDLDRLNLEGSVASGKGVLNLNGEVLLQAEQGFPSKLRIQGKDWVAVNVPQAEVHVSPDLSIDYTQERTDLQGEIHLPYARIRLRKLPESAATNSPDLIIVGGDSPSQQPTDPRLYTTIRLILGDRVSFAGLGLRGNLTGNLQIIDEPGRPIMGRGRIGITEGTYRAYGQDLKIERGYALFANSPVDNPGLDVRAVREAGEVTAGVQVTGSLRSPIMTLFSTPSMNKTEVISYLLTGRPPGESGGNIDLSAAMMASGAGSVTEEIGRQFGLEELRLETEGNLSEASVVAGTYLSPRLYVQFVNDLVTRESLLRLRYDLTDRLQIQTESGSSQGGDIFYIFEHE